MVGHDFAVPVPGGRGDFAHFRRRQCQRLVAENIASGIERLQNLLLVTAGRRGDYHQFRRFRIEKFRNGTVAAGHPESFAGVCNPFRQRICDRFQRESGMARQFRQMEFPGDPAKFGQGGSDFHVSAHFPAGGGRG